MALERLKALLTNILFDEIQKSFLINLAKHSDNPDIAKLLEEIPATP
ncbi:hypothetical protein GPUN_0401 [Glaciecola punicea ACAM 611]|jgi:hypothetical protein|uniref:Uncharacterized protein n=1 Tax=Glaciecola punicea ACAM 611 TaxID=1121923 RepID=H5T8A7_9ALTE|nr:hypothetical protein GPUN_0401 [Glaciecola punicea ACAM 611]